jgi:D-2-hydroxyacid dehydrogenase (NADP+)
VTDIPLQNEKLLIVINWDDGTRSSYERLIQARFPSLPIVTVRGDEAQREIGDATILMAFGGHLPKGIFVQAKRLRWVHSFGTGVDGIVDQPELKSDVIVTATRGIHGPPMSELALLLMLSLVRDFPRTLRAQQAQRWERWRVGLLQGKTVGILGLGRIAEDLAPRCKALGMRVVGISGTPRPLPGFDEILLRQNLVQAVSALDFLVLLIPHSSESHNIINSAIFAAMKPTAFLVNIARGGVVDEAALVEALQNKQIAGAAIDVMQTEPLPAGDPLWSAPNLIITPHIGGYYDRYVDDSIDQICTNITKFLEGAAGAMVNRIEH